MMSLSDSKAILSKLSKTVMKKPVVAKPTADLLNACHKGVVDALRDLCQTNPDAFSRLREEANAKPVRTLPRRPTKVVVEPKKGDESQFYCDIFSHENVRLQHDGAGGFYCGDCEEEEFDKRYDDNESDDESDYSDEESESDDEDEDEWMEVYTDCVFGLCFSGERRELQKYKDFRYYQCWGGGPEGGYITDGNETYRVNRTWGKPFTVKWVDGEIEEDRSKPMMLIRIITTMCGKCHTYVKPEDCYNNGFHTKEVDRTYCMKCYDIIQFQSYVLLAGAKVEKRGDLMWVIVRDDENFMANKSILQDNAFDYAKCKKDGIWDFHDHPHHGCFTFSKK